MAQRPRKPSKPSAQRSPADSGWHRNVILENRAERSGFSVFTGLRRVEIGAAKSAGWIKFGME
jgi:hypothetical protein